MGMISKAVDWAGEHPITTAVGAFAIGAVLLIVLKGGGGGGAGSAMSSFYAAQAAQAASGNTLAASQAQSAAAVSVAQIAAARDVTIAQTSGSTQTGLAQINGSTQVQLAQINAPLALAQETTNQQAQKQQFWLATGEQQLQGQAAPYLLQDLARGGNSGAGAAAVWADFIGGGTAYHAAHG